MKNMDEKTCPGCSGTITELTAFGAVPELQGVCSKCGGAYLRPVRSVLAVSWCKCKQVPHAEESYYFTETSHGWLHNVCGQITQTG